jgi:hypothetical protein
MNLLKLLKATEDICKERETSLKQELKDLGVKLNSDGKDYDKYLIPLAYSIDPFYILTRVKDEFKKILENAQMNVKQSKTSISQPEEQTSSIIIEMPEVFNQQRLNNKRSLSISIPKDKEEIKEKLEKLLIKDLFDLECLDLDSEEQSKAQLKEELNSFLKKLQESVNSKESSDETELLSKNFFDIFSTILEENNVYSINVLINMLHQLNCQLIEQVGNHFKAQKFKTVFSIQSSFLSSLIYENKKRRNRKPLNEIIHNIFNNYLYYYWLITNNKDEINKEVYNFILDRVWRTPQEKYQYIEHKNKDFILIVIGYFDKLLFNSLKVTTLKVFSILNIYILDIEISLKKKLLLMKKRSIFPFMSQLWV